MLNTKNYYLQVKEDAKEYIEDELMWILEAWDNNGQGEIIEEINDFLWTADAVTGNGSGSYYFNSFKARENVLNNIEDVIQAFKDDDDLNTFADYLINEEWEAIDVYTRCSVLYEAVSDLITDGEIEKPFYIFNNAGSYGSIQKFFDTEEEAIKTAEEELYYMTEGEEDDVTEYEIIQATLTDLYNDDLYKTVVIKDFLNN